MCKSTWDGENRLTSIDGSAASSFDALDRRAEFGSGSPYTLMLYPPFDPGYRVGSANQQSAVSIRLQLPGGLKAIYNASGIASYRVANWQGSQPMSVAPNRTFILENRFTPWGEFYGYLNGYNGFFAGMLGITANGAMNDSYEAAYRLYNEQQGRWVSPDPAGLSAVDITRPQSWNRYVYVGNDPLNNTDPSGLICRSVVDPVTQQKRCAGPNDIYVPKDSPPAALGGTANLQSGGNIPGSGGSAPSKPMTIMCMGTARVLKGNAATIGKPGGFSGSSVGNFPVTKNGAAIIPSQFGLSKSALRPYIGQISGVFPNAGISFMGVVDIVGGTPPPGYTNVQTGLMALNPGNLIIELPGATMDYGTTAVTLTLPTAVGCPAGTTMVAVP